MLSGLEKVKKPDWHCSPAYERTLGPAVSELAALAGFKPYPEQDLLLNDLFALNPNDPTKSAAFEMGVVCARQQMKTGFLKQAALVLMCFSDRTVVVSSRSLTFFATTKPGVIR